MSSVAAFGIDAGSTTCKVVAVDHRGELLDSMLAPTEPRIELQAARMLDMLRSDLEANGEVPSIATGYGRKLIKKSSICTHWAEVPARTLAKDPRNVG